MRYDESRYGDDGDFVLTRPKLTPIQITQVQTVLATSPAEETTYLQLTADQNDFALSGSKKHRFTTDASRTITGFASVGIDIYAIINVGAQDLVLANNSGSSVAENRILTHTGANITLNPNESALIVYDRTSTRVRTIGFAP